MDTEILNGFVRFIRIPAAGLAIAGNVLIVIVIFRYSAMRNNASNLLIAQLAFADVLMGVSLIIRFVTNEIQLASGCTIFDAALCMAVGAPTIFSAHIDQITMLGIAIERLFCVKFPIQYRKLSVGRFSMAYFVFSVMWSILGTGAMFIGFPYGDQTVHCSTGSHWNHFYSIYFIIFASGLSLIICVIYLYVILFVRWRVTSSASNKAERNLMATLSAVVVAYFIFWCSPNVIYMTAVITGLTKHTRGIIIYIIIISNCFYSTFNFFIYICIHTEFRRHFLMQFSNRNTAKVGSRQLAAIKSNPRNTRWTRSWSNPS